MKGQFVYRLSFYNKSVRQVGSVVPSTMYTPYLYLMYGQE